MFLVEKDKAGYTELQHLTSLISQLDSQIKWDQNWKTLSNINSTKGNYYLPPLRGEGGGQKI